MKKSALITGGSKGIGRAISLKLAEDGYYVFINYHSDDNAAQETMEKVLHSGGSGELLKFDVANGEQVKEHILPICEKEDVSLDIFVHNAGMAIDSTLVWMTEDNWNNVMATNLNSFFYIAKIVAKTMISKKYGRIITISSTSGQSGMRGQFNYSASKGGLIAASKSLALELASRKITVNVVSPGFIDTEMLAEIDIAKIKPLIPMKRIGKPEEVAAVVSFLASQQSSYVTGQVIGVNGGMYT